LRDDCVEGKEEEDSLCDDCVEGKKKKTLCVMIVLRKGRRRLFV
jgi:hypothetical protein